jgi:hypothetical protein
VLHMRRPEKCWGTSSTSEGTRNAKRLVFSGKTAHKYFKRLDRLCDLPTGFEQHSSLLSDADLQKRGLQQSQDLDATLQNFPQLLLPVGCRGVTSSLASHHSLVDVAWGKDGCGVNGDLAAFIIDSTGTAP